ncbi:MAG: hypothetical protein ACI88Z_001204 [Sphingobacteriales bacterium]|jgi:hypothetical protein
MSRPLKVLFSIFLVFVSFSSKGQNVDSFYIEANKFFQTYVSEGRVDYKGLINSKADIESLINQIATADLLFSNEKEVKAFYLNAYNLLVINTVVNSYPISSVLDDSSFFSEEHMVAGETIRLDEIRTEKLTQRFYDKRIYFALINGYAGGPEIQPWGFSPYFVENQLREFARLTFNNPKFIRYKNGRDKVYVPVFFKDNLDVFAANEFGLIDFFNEYRGQKIPPYASVIYYDIDRNLNDKGKKTPTKTKVVRKKQNAPDFFQSPLSLLPRGYAEAKLFNNLYTQTGFFDEGGEVVEQANRSTYLTSSFRTLFGVSKYINVGFDVYFKSVRLHDLESSPLEAFNFEKGSFTRTAITQFAPSIKFTPFRRAQWLSVYTSFIIPTVEDQEGRYLDFPFLSFDAYNLFNQIMVDLEINSKIDLFGEVDASFFFNRNGTNESVRFQSPIKTLLLFYPSSKVALYGLLEWAPEWQNQQEKLGSYFMQRGVGFKYKISPIAEVEFIYTDFFKGKSQGAGSTLNTGLRVRF